MPHTSTLEHEAHGPSDTSTVLEPQRDSIALHEATCYNVK